MSVLHPSWWAGGPIFEHSDEKVFQVAATATSTIAARGGLDLPPISVVPLIVHRCGMGRLGSRYPKLCGRNVGAIPISLQDEGGSRCWSSEIARCCRAEVGVLLVSDDERSALKANREQDLRQQLVNAENEVAAVRTAPPQDMTRPTLIAGLRLGTVPSTFIFPLRPRMGRRRYRLRRSLPHYRRTTSRRLPTAHSARRAFVESIVWETKQALPPAFGFVTHLLAHHLCDPSPPEPNMQIAPGPREDGCIAASVG